MRHLTTAVWTIVVALAILAAGPLASGANAQGVDTRAVCFAVHNGAVATRVLGTRFQAQGSAGPDASRVILLVHGHSVSSRFWDWKPDYSVARGLARAGYLVISYDRLTVGKSTYPAGADPDTQLAAGNTVTFDSDREMIAEIVEQLRGTYPLPTSSPAGPCAASESPGTGPASKVVLMGHSLGGSLVSGYPAEFANNHNARVDALVKAESSDVGVSQKARDVINHKATSPDNVQADQASLFLDDGSTREHSTISPQTCEDNVQLLTIPSDLFAAACDPSSYETVPYGDFVSAAKIKEENQSLITQTPSTLPVLLAWADHDGLAPSDPSLGEKDALGQPVCGAAGCQQAEVDYWKANCPCASHVTSWTQKDSGHTFVWSATMPTFTHQVVTWLKANGLG
jgi:pimeloyl-ACP methyl ester carboxylesterase